VTWHITSTKMLYPISKPVSQSIAKLPLVKSPNFPVFRYNSPYFSGLPVDRRSHHRSSVDRGFLGAKANRRRWIRGKLRILAQNVYSKPITAACAAKFCPLMPDCVITGFGYNFSFPAAPRWPPKPPPKTTANFCPPHSP
jgi:hypothetical protein